MDTLANFRRHRVAVLRMLDDVDSVEDFRRVAPRCAI
jgi:hypothetical protein